jgi:NitT/TauT family transport system permease protein
VTPRGPIAFALRLVFLAALVGLWQLAVMVFDLPAFIVPAPTDVARALYRGIDSGIFATHFYVTLAETLLGFALACGLALVLGGVIAMSRTIEYHLNPLVVMFQSMPKLALAPIVILWFGLGIKSKVIGAALVAFFPLMVNTIAGLRSADEDRVSLMRSLGATRWQILAMLQLPSALPYLFAGLEVAMSLSLIGAIVTELLGAEQGLGMLMQSMTYNMDMAGEFSILFIFAILGLVLHAVVVRVRRAVLFWDRSRDGELPSASKGDVS